MSNTEQDVLARWQTGLQQGTQALGMVLSDAQQAQLVQFMQMLLKWNKVYNLTALRSADEVLSHHVLDSLTAVPALQRHLATLPVQTEPRRLLDVGSGGGLPGVVFAICCPELNIHCVDTVGKKAAFIQQVAAALHLPHLRGIHARVESLTDCYDVISCRAFASLEDFTSWSVQALAPEGIWLAMKARHLQEELDALPANVVVQSIEPLQVPGLDAERCIVWMRAVA